jgi:predicted secreted protein
MPYTGLTAKLTVGSAEVAYISNWSVEESCDTIEITQLGSNGKEVLPSLCYWTASAEGTADFSTLSAQKTLRDAMLSGTPVEVKFYLDENTALKGTAIVTAFSVNISTEDKGGVSISLTGNGKLSFENIHTPDGQNI